MSVNTIRNHPSRLPTKVKRLVRDSLSQVKLEAALMAGGAEPLDEFEISLNSLIGELRDIEPERFEAIRMNIKNSVSNFRNNPAFLAFSTIPVLNLDAVRGVQVAELHRSAVAPLRREWIDLGPHDPGNIDPFRRVYLQDEIQGVRFRLKEVKCFDETDEKILFAWNEWGEDDIYMFVNPIDENGNTNGSKYFKVGNFDDGDTKVYPGSGMDIQYFNLHEGGDTFPKIYHVTLTLLDHDSDKLAEWFKRVADLVKDKVVSVLASAVGFAVGSALGPLGSLVGAAIGWAVGEIIGMIHGWFKSEHIGTATIGCTINGYHGTWLDSGGDVSNTYTRDFRGARAHYRVYWAAEMIR